jgi:conjugative relaxase-like TrwC/TraI family protein
VFNPKTIRCQSGTGGSNYVRDYLAQGVYDEGGIPSYFVGEWFGQLAGDFGLQGRRIDLSDPWIDGLTNNYHPHTKEPFFRHDRTEIRFFDFQCSPPKSISIMSEVAEDRRIFDVHVKAVKAGLREIEAAAGTRLLTANKVRTVNTRKICAMLYHHGSSRTLDPQIHTHCLIANLQHVPDHGYSSLNSKALWYRLRYFSRVYDCVLTAGLNELGYDVRNERIDRAVPGETAGKDSILTLKGERIGIAGVPEEIGLRFSKRSRAIEGHVAKKVRGRPPTRKDRSVAALATRSAKRKGLGAADLQVMYRKQLTNEEEKTLRSLVPAKSRKPARFDYGAAITNLVENLQSHAKYTGPHVARGIPVWELMADIIQEKPGNRIDLDVLKKKMIDSPEFKTTYRSSGDPSLFSYSTLAESLDSETDFSRSIDRFSATTRDVYESQVSIDDLQEELKGVHHSVHPLIVVRIDASQNETRNALRSKAVSSITEILGEEVVVDFEKNMDSMTEIQRKFTTIREKGKTIVLVSTESNSTALPSVLSMDGRFKSITVTDQESKQRRFIRRIHDPDFGKVVEGYVDAFTSSNIIAGLSYAENRETTTKLNVAIREKLLDAGSLKNEKTFNHVVLTTEPPDTKDIHVIPVRNYRNFVKGAKPRKIRISRSKKWYKIGKTGNWISNKMFAVNFRYVSEQKIPIATGEVIVAKKISEGVHAKPEFLCVQKSGVRTLDCIDAFGKEVKISGDEYTIEHGYVFHAKNVVPDVGKCVFIYEEGNTRMHMRYPESDDVHVILSGVEACSSTNAGKNVKYEYIRSGGITTPDPEVEMARMILDAKIGYKRMYSSGAFGAPMLEPDLLSRPKMTVPVATVSVPHKQHVRPTRQIGR